MISFRALLVSGTFAAGLSAGMLCGAGLANADTAGDSGTANSSARASTESPRTERGLGRAPAPSARPAAAAAVRIPGARVAPANAANSVPVSGKSTPAADSTVNALAARVVASVSSAAVLPASSATPPARPVTVGLNSRRSVSSPEPAKSAAALASPPTAAAAITAPAAAAQPVPVVPSSVPVDPAKFAGTYYEQGSVKQFFSIGLVNTKATYTLNPDGTIRVQNSGNYFFKRGPRSSIVGSAVVVNATNTALNVGFSPFSPPSATPPGNYTILANAPDYSWVIVSDPSGRSGYILTRNKTISPQEYRQLVDQARSLGVRGRITPTVQYA